MWFHLLLVVAGSFTTCAQAYGLIEWSGLVLTPKGFTGHSNGLVPPASMVLQDPLESMSSKFGPYFAAKSDGSIVWENTKWCIEADEASGDVVRMGHCSGEPTQKWAWVPDGHGRNMIQLKDSKKCLDSGVGALVGAPIVLRECKQKVTDVWKLEESVSQGGSASRVFFLFGVLSFLVFSMYAFRSWHREWITKHRTPALSQGLAPLSADPEVGVPLTDHLAIRADSFKPWNAKRVVSRSASPAMFDTGSTDHVDVQAFIDTVNYGYEKVHRDFEEQFWGTKMALGDPKFSTQALARTKGEMEQFLSQADTLEKARHWLDSGRANEEQKRVLKMFERTFSCYIMESDEAKEIRQEVTRKESEIEAQRNIMKLGADLPGEGFQELSLPGLLTRMRIDPDEAVRKACFDGISSIGPFICTNGFCDIVKMRNKMAKTLGYEDFYDYKVQQAEGFSKTQLFEILDKLELGTRELLVLARSSIASDKGEDALKPWNLGFIMAGDVTKKMDPYFPFEKAVEKWARSYAAMGINYKKSTMTLDLLDRKHKYSNGFCHWPQPAWMRPGGDWQPSSANFTSLADPNAVGSGYNALVTLMHEAGHAAHMANVVQPSPLFAQERAPTSVAYAENQSMFLDSLVGDAAWRGRYARDREGNAVPWEILEEDLKAKTPYRVFQLRNMLAVCYFEKALYELPDAEVTAERIQQLADEVEKRVQGGPSGRPILAVPHILSDEASCYYHGYVLAEMAVHQTRKYFFDTHGYIVDNPIVGPTLRDNYWLPGSSGKFLDLVEGLTGEPFTGDAWISELERPLEEVLRNERADYDEAVKAGPAITGDVDLCMRARFVDGDEMIADSQDEASFVVTASKFEEYVKQRTA